MENRTVTFGQIEFRGEKNDRIAYLNGEDTPFSGRVEHFHGNGQMSEEGSYREGKPFGVWTHWFENGKKNREYNCLEDGQQDGLFTSWWDNGSIMCLSMTKYGKTEGLLVTFYQNGRLRDRQTYGGGLLQSATVLKPGGEECATTNVQDGQGIVVNYNDDGSESFRSEYKDGIDVNMPRV